MILRALAVLGCVSFLAGCSSTGGESGEGARPSVLSQTPASDQQQRAKNHVELGSLYLLDNRPAIALEEARIALSADSAYAPAFNLLGMTHMHMKEPRLAEENFLKALQLAPGDPEISNNYGWFLCQFNRPKQSLPYFIAAGKNPLYTSPTKAYTNAGICARKAQDQKAAEEHLLAALRLAPSNTLAMYYLADLTYELGRYTVAKQWVSDLERIEEPTAEVLWLALRIERKLGNREGELRYGTQLRRKFAGSEEFRLLNQGQYE